MSQRFDYFVVFAEMRTGSNLLESHLNNMQGITSHGEAFNPHFIGFPNAGEILGTNIQARDKNPQTLINAIRSANGLHGFRYFSDHEPGVFEEIVSNPRCGKIVLTRNILDSYVSLKIANATGQWKLTKAKHARSQKVRFEAQEFNDRLNTLRAFQLKLSNALQENGQTAFYIDYDDLNSPKTLSGLANFLGTTIELSDLSSDLKRQNPGSLDEKVENFAEMKQALAILDQNGLGRFPNFEPKRGPNVPSYLASQTSPLLFLPIKSGPTDRISNWIAEIDGAKDQGPAKGFTQGLLREWMKSNKGFRSFTVLRHPVMRAHTAFSDEFWSAKPVKFPAIRKALERDYSVVFPEASDQMYSDVGAYKRALLGFLSFVHDNLNDRTALRTDPSWASQHSILSGICEFCIPDFVLREDTLIADIEMLCGSLNIEAPSTADSLNDGFQEILDEVYDNEIESTVRKAYAKDYLRFGFDPWRS